MSDLKKILQKKYQSEVQPEFTEAAWESFVSYQAAQYPEKNNRKRRFLWIFLFLGLGIMASFSFAYLKNVKSNQSKYYQESSSAATTSTIVNQPSTINQQKTKQLNSSAENIISATTISVSPESSMIDQHNNATNSKLIEEPILKKNTNTDRSQNSFPQPITNSNQDNREETPPIVANTEIKDHQNNDKQTNLNPLTIEPYERRPLISALNIIPVSQRKIAIPPSTEWADPIIPLHQLREEGRWMANLELGTGTMAHRSISNVELGVAQTRLQYKLTPHWRLEGMVAFQQIDYISRVQNRSLGLRSVPLPRSSLNLSYVRSSTTYLETGVGINYEVEPIDRIKMAFGPRFRYITELGRNLTYEFVEEGNAAEQVHATLDERNNHPYNIEIHTDVYFEISSKFEIGISGNYLRPINQNTVILPTQWRILAGIRKKF